MKTVAFELPGSFGQSYFEKHQNYAERADLLDSRINKSELKFKKRLKKARLIDKSRNYIWELKKIEKEMVKRGYCSVESVSKLRDAITILKQIAK